MAVENLFAKVHVSAKKAPAHEARRDENERAETEKQRTEDARFKRNVLFALIAIAVMIASGVMMAVHEKQEPVHEKREGR